MNLGWTEILLIGGVALLLFGPSKLPTLGRSLGESIRGFKKALSEDPKDEREVPQVTQNSEKPMNKQTEEQKETNKHS
jgi:sec-independent protein translocase protein TatA